MIIYKTEYGNFDCPRDLLQYMREESIKTVHVTAELLGTPVGQSDFEMSVEEIERWIEMGKEGKQ